MRILFLIILLSLFWSCEENQIGTLEKTSHKVKFVKPLSSFGSLKDSLENSGRYNALSVAIIRPDTTVTWDYGLANDSSRKSIYLDDNPKNNFSINGQTRYALVTDENGEKVIQKISYPWEAYKRIPCDKK